MAINSTLAFVRGMVKSETAKSLQTSSTAQDAEINQIIYDVQQWQAADYPWPHLRTRWNVSLSAGNRFVSFPSTDTQGNITSIDVGRLGDIQVFVKWSGIWQPVEYGIDEIGELNYLDSDAGQVLDPVQRWMLSNNAASTVTVQFEVWPRPAGSQTVRFVGQRVLTELRVIPLASPVTWDDTKTLDLDDQLVAYFVTAEYLTREKQPNAQYFLGLATNRMNQLRRTYPRKELSCIIGGTTTLDKRALRLVPLVLVGGAKTP